MKLSEPNDLLHLYYKYGVQQFPVTDQGEISGKIQKSAVVRHLSRSENFESNIINTIDRLLEPADESLLRDLKDQLRSGDVTGIPVVDVNGTVDQVITPGHLEVKKETNEIIEESRKRSLYEKLFEKIPFPIRLLCGNETIYCNEQFRSSMQEFEFTVIQLEEDQYTLEMFLPTILKKILDGFHSIQDGQSIDLRNLLDHLEEGLMNEAYRREESITSAAELVGLPRQTFNYRWKQYDVPTEKSSDTSSEVQRSVN